MGLRKKLNDILSSDNEIIVELKDNGEKYELYLNDEYISHVLDSKYKAVDYRLIDLDHIDLQVDKLKSGDYKILPVIYSRIPE